MYHAGIGQRHVSNFMAALEIQQLHHKSMKAREREISPAIQKVAEESCRKALQEERDLSLQRRYVVLLLYNKKKKKKKKKKRISMFFI